VSQTWKDLERTVAKKLKGKRKWNRAFNFGISDSDILSPCFEIDAKYGKQVSSKHSVLLKKHGKSELLFLVKDRHNPCVIATLDTFVNYLHGEDCAMKFLETKGLVQCHNWAKEIRRKYGKKGLVPLVVTKRPGEQHEVVFMKLFGDWVPYLANVSEVYRHGISEWKKLGFYKDDVSAEKLPFFRLNGETVDCDGEVIGHWRI